MASDKNLFFHGTVYTHGSMNCLPLAGVFVLDVVIFGMQKQNKKIGFKVHT